jgi:hypothetical protein
LCAAVTGTGGATVYKRGRWSRPTIIDAGAADGTSALAGVSCGSTSLCVAYDTTSTDVFAYDGHSWAAEATGDSDGGGIYAVACASTSFCIALDRVGDALVYNGRTWGPPLLIDAAGTVASISCASSSFCVVGDDLGDAVVYRRGAWSAPVRIDATGDGGFDALTCPSASFCMAAHGSRVITYQRGKWRATRRVGRQPIVALSCASRRLCIAVENGGASAASGSAFRYGASRWRAVPRRLTKGTPASTACSSSPCVVLDVSGKAAVYKHGVWRRRGAVPGA